MKIVNIIFDSRLGGPQWRIAEVGRILKTDFGIETVVVFPERDSEKFKNILENYGIEFKSVKLHKLSKSPMEFFKWLLFFIPETVKLIKIIKESKADIVHTNASWQWKGVIAGKLAGKKLVWHLNDTKIPFYIKAVFKLLIKKVDGIIVAGSKVREYYLKNFKIFKPVFEIQAPVDTKRFDPEKTDYDRKISECKGIKILSIGNVNPYKGFEYLIDAAKILNKKYDNLYFFIAGNLFDSQKKYIDMLKNRMKNYGLGNFIFLGGIDNVPEVLKSSDIYVCSSISEASPQSVWEAMAMEKPIVSTDVGSVSDFLRDGENGFIVPIKKPDKLAEKIEILIENPELRKEFGKKSRKTAEKLLDLKICAQKHKLAYESIKGKSS